MRFVLKGLLVIVLVGLAGGVYYLRFGRQLSDRELVEKASKLILFPDEVPTIATVTDKSKLEDQKFFKMAENGDRVLIFPIASKAILYRPKANKIIDVATVLQGSTQITVDSLSVSDDNTPISVALYNGTKKAGLTDLAEKKIIDKFKNVLVESKDKAERNDFATTTIIDVRGKSRQVIGEIAKLLGASVSSLPVGESSPDVDLIIILGKDFLTK